LSQQEEIDAFLAEIQPLLKLYLVWQNSSKAKVDLSLDNELTEARKLVHSLERRTEQVFKSLEEEEKRLSKVQVESQRC
jgi:hypothetical protein